MGANSYIISRSMIFQDNKFLFFGTDKDYGFKFDSAKGRMVLKGGFQVGTFGDPDAYASDEFIEIHLEQSGAAEGKPATRFRCSNAVAKTGGQVVAMQVQAYSQAGVADAGVNASEICALLAEGGLKSQSTYLSSTHSACAARFKIEDDYATGGQATGAPTWTGGAAGIIIEGQLSANPTGEYSAIEFNCQSPEAGTNVPWDSMFWISSAGQNPSIVNVFKFAAATACAVVSGGTYTTAEGYLVISVAGSTYQMPFYTAAD